ncbi:phage tail protein [Marinicella sediminis]|uniref:Phage tail protein n=1 Tax=Marinicella sediminis TaxID=1792834 RepID=A0ABV7JEG2_9GAMM|nr:tail fiber protein [Marinicella sediminis]
MSEPFLAEIRMMGFNFAPRGWAFCDGQILPINQNQSLYSLLGTTYGGDGRTSFALPEMRGRTPIHVGQGDGSTYTEGQKSGEETHTLAANEMPQHNHGVNASNKDGDAPIPNDNTLAGFNNGYNSGGNLIGLTTEVTNAGGGQAHNNMQPTLAVNFCIALRGLFPSRN